MAAIFCLFSVALCKFPEHSISQHSNHLETNSVLPLSAQLVTVPRVYISPCPESFRYTFNGKEWFGLVVIGKPARRGIPSRLKVQLSVGFNYNSVSFRVSQEQLEIIKAFCRCSNTTARSLWRRIRRVQSMTSRTGIHCFTVFGFQFKIRCRS